ncbi:arsenate reductase ArsC [bacterium]|nr:arsenate reductase ArsC [bacterium]
MKKKIIFICIHNSARSQMAAAYLTHFGGEEFEAHSAGLTPGTLNPLAVAAMRDDGIDISQNSVNSVDEFVDGHIQFNYVITVCDESAAERCPYFPGQGARLHWGFVDPSSLGGSDDEKLNETIKIRNQIKAKIQKFVGC